MPRSYQDEELILQRVLAESLLTSHQSASQTNQTSAATDNLPRIHLPNSGDGDDNGDTSTVVAAVAASGDDLARALEISKREEEERKRRELEEEEELKRVLELSLLEK